MKLDYVLFFQKSGSANFFCISFSYAISAAESLYLLIPDAVLKEAYRILKKEGLVLIIDLLHHEEHWPLDKFGDLWPGFSSLDLQEKLQRQHFKNIYNQLVSKLEERSRLGGVMATMHWDQEVIMPKGSLDNRSKQMAALAGVLHEKSVDSDFGRLIDKLVNADPINFTKIEQCNINEAKRDYELETKIPKELIQEIAELSSRGHQIWTKAREENKFEDFAPTLERLIFLKKNGQNLPFQT